MPREHEYAVYECGEHVATIKYPEEAAAFASIIGDGAEVRCCHSRLVWKEGSEEFPVSESYDRAGNIIRERVAYIYFPAE
ncbi:hypothetical protein UFOVP142_64 [uncultured Caudovirales phage]|uniref:Uncharacterized protein n=1 Tax=uncultured Caudovirales phage TaxID=2100421 RepID=A0A6J7XUK6_9CAUD|nr:hypothetical protein UFOVP142_64 [uncultured Caudovirales phage]